MKGQLQTWPCQSQEVTNGSMPVCEEGELEDADGC